jgi:2-polyprenyl-3-methyl-5-hydroxy-6-metoxy-1,4-benzoquinol methylase
MKEKLTSCPVCKNENFSGFLEVKDHFLSGATFNIVQCDGCGFKFVNPRPDQNEIGVFYQSAEYISHDTGKADFFTWLYKRARSIAIKGKHQLVKKYATGSRLLDIGCGTGEFLSYCQDQGMEVAGIEPNEKARSFAKSQKGISVEKGFPETGVTRHQFDCITMWHVLEHVHDLHEYMENIRSLLTENGTFIVAVPNSNSWDAAFYKEFWAAYDVPRHLYHFNKKTMGRLADQYGFHITAMFPQKMDAYYVSLLSEKYKTGRSGYFKAAINGFWSNFVSGSQNRGHSSQIFILAQKSANFKASV